MFVTRTIFEQIIKSQLPILSGGLSARRVSQPSLDYHESNALHYCGGYIVRSLIKKVQTSSVCNKEDLVYCLQDLIDDDEVGYTESSEWTSAGNRGGLVKFHDAFFEFLIAVEVEVRDHFPALSPGISGYADENLKHRAIESAASSENVKFYWKIVTVNWCSIVAQTLLKIVLEHYVTIRGFSFAKGFIEKYKRKMSKSTQKSKGLRKIVNNTTACHNE